MLFGVASDVRSIESSLTVKSVLLTNDDGVMAAISFKVV